MIELLNIEVGRIEDGAQDKLAISMDREIDRQFGASLSASDHRDTARGGGSSPARSWRPHHDRHRCSHSQRVLRNSDV